MEPELKKVMPARTLADDISREPVWLAAAIVVIAGSAILAALGFQHVGGYQPCALCLMQRTPYYVGIPLAAAAGLSAWIGAPRQVTATLFALFAALMLSNAGLAAYQSGVEWKLWEGPASCAPSVGVNNAADMLDQLQNTRAPSCTEATWRFLGLSFAGWNVLISAALAALGAVGAAVSARRAPASRRPQLSAPR